MSSSYEYSYELEAELRREKYLKRISLNTKNFYNRYNQQYLNMRERGLAAYIPAEMSRLESDLSKIKRLLTENPEKAKELSFEVGSYIRSMSSLASKAREQFEQAEKKRVELLRAEREQRQNILMKEYFEILRTIDPIVVNYSIAPMQQLRNEIESGRLTSLFELRKKQHLLFQQLKVKLLNGKQMRLRKIVPKM